MKRGRRSSTSNPRRKKCKVEDIISELPEPILHDILSRLPTKDATKTCVLSKTWNSVWNSFPVLDFNQNTFEQSMATSSSGNQSKNRKKVIQDFCNYVENTINSRGQNCSSIRKFQLLVNFQGCTGHATKRAQIGKWLNYAINSNVQELVLSNTTSLPTKKAWHYPLPLSLFHAKTLKELNLFGCQFMVSGVKVEFSLKKLVLLHVRMDQNTLQNMVSNCHNLEELCIGHCEGFQLLNVSSLKLTSVDLYLSRDKVQTVAIEAPNLQSLSYGGGSDNIQNSLMASNHYNLKKMTLHDIDITESFFPMIANFPLLENLELIRCCLLESFQIENNRLSSLTISDCLKLKYILLNVASGPNHLQAPWTFKLMQGSNVCRL